MVSERIKSTLVLTGWCTLFGSVALAFLSGFHTNSWNRIVWEVDGLRKFSSRISAEQLDSFRFFLRAGEDCDAAFDSLSVLNDKGLAIRIVKSCSGGEGDHPRITEDGFRPVAMVHPEAAGMPCEACVAVCDAEVWAVDVEAEATRAEKAWLYMIISWTVSGCLLLTSLAMFLIAVLDEERRFHIARRLGLADLSKLNDTPARASTVSCESKGTARSKDTFEVEDISFRQIISTKRVKSASDVAAVRRANTNAEDKVVAVVTSPAAPGSQGSARGCMKPMKFGNLGNDVELGRTKSGMKE